jgi:hypothetical protein
MKIKYDINHPQKEGSLIIVDSNNKRLARQNNTVKIPGSLAVGATTIPDGNINIVKNAGIYKIYEDDFENGLTGWSTSKNVSVSNGVVSLADASGSASETLSYPISQYEMTQPRNRKFVLEATISLPSTQKLFFSLHGCSAAIINYSTGRILLDTPSQEYEIVSPTNYNESEKHKLLMLFDPTNETMAFYLYWKDSSTGRGRMEKIGTAEWVFDATSLPSQISFGTSILPTFTDARENCFLVQHHNDMEGIADQIYANYTPDGIHYNTIGYRALANRAWRVISECPKLREN